MKTKKTETLASIGFDKTEQLLLTHGYRIGDLFHMNGYLHFCLIQTGDNRPLVEGHYFKRCGKVTVRRKHHTFYAVYSQKPDICAKGHFLSEAVKTAVFD